MDKIRPAIPHFGCIPLYKVQLKSKKKPERVISPVISLLEKNDAPRFAHEATLWQGTAFGPYILNLFRNNVNQKLPGNIFLSLEIPKETAYKGKTRLRGLAYLSAQKNCAMEIHYIQSESANRNLDDHYKGTGSCLLYGAIKIAEALNTKLVYLRAISTSKLFYEQFPEFTQTLENDTTYYQMNYTDYKNFTEELAKMYAIKPLFKKENNPLKLIFPD